MRKAAKMEAGKMNLNVRFDNVIKEIEIILFIILIFSRLFVEGYARACDPLSP